MRGTFRPTVPADDPDTTEILIGHLNQAIETGDGDAADKAITHIQTAAGPIFTRQLLSYLMGQGALSRS